LKLKRIHFIALAIVIIIIILISANHFLTPTVNEEYLGGKYEAKVLIKGTHLDFDAGEITYTKEGEEHKGFYISYLNPALNLFVKDEEKIPEDAVFLNWWDYGHMIVGYGERESVLKNPSEEALDSVIDPEGIVEFDPHDRLVDVARALTAIDVDTTKSIMDRYGAKYLLITTEDGGSKASWIFQYSGLNSTEYVGATSMTFNYKDYTDLGKETTIYRLLSESIVDDLTRIYSDDYVKIFEMP
jgi:hypothetical protein